MLAAGAASPPVLFNRDIRPILSETCFPCHGFDAGKRKADLRLDTPEGATAIHKGGRAVKGGDLNGSEMWRRISSTDPKSVMPPPEAKRRLKPAEMGLIRQWIELGAVYQKHWAFEPPERPALPAVKRQGWARNEVDYFILAALESKGLEPAPEAPARALVRRVTLDLTGLPPTPGEVEAYLADRGPKAYERLVDRLLESPRYGEQMARYWLDVARYADTHGMHINNERGIWAYRDWVVGAFNRNLPFDQFTTWQLAGDLLPNPSREQLVASGFNRCNLSTSEGGAIDEEFRVRYAVDRVTTTSTTWLGLTMGCAACHDHKFDPISQKEFYQMCAIFNNISENAMDGNALLPPPSLALPSPEQEKRSKELAARASELQKELDQTVAALAYTDPASLTSGPPKAGSVSTKDPTHDPSLSLAVWEKQQRESGGPSKGPKEIRQLLKKAPAKLEPAERRKLRDYYLASVYADPQSPVGPLRAQLKSIQEKREALEKEIPATLISRELDKPRHMWVRIRGQYDKHGVPVGPGVPAVLPPLPASEATNRLTLARWLIDPKNPLPARVTVNRFWQQFFGVGIVKTSEDFGTRGEWPSHPELLDWLASEFVRSGWDVKQTVRRLVTSAAYRQDSRVSPELLAMDPENRLLARGPRYRLDAEELRDYALSVSGLLNLKMGGRGVHPYQPPGIWEAVGYTTSDTAKYTQDHGEALYRRSLYTFWKRTAPPPSMTTLDAPTREQCWARRERTDTPLQALLMMNDPQYFEAARQLGYRMWHEGGANDASRLAYGFELATARPPAPRESAVLMEALAAQRAHYCADADAARKLIAVGEWPVPTDLPPAELAAYSVVGNLLLNLDEVVTKN